MDDILLHRIRGREKIAGRVKEIYEGAFPIEERRPWESILSLKEQSEFYRFYQIGDCDGLVTIWDFPEAVYVEHLAVDPALRGSGLGGKVIEEICGMVCGKPVVLEVEPACTSDIAGRRIGFYRRHGFEVIEGYRYIQPPYSEGLNAVELMIMTTGEIDGGIERFVRERLYKEVYGRGV